MRIGKMDATYQKFQIKIQNIGRRAGPQNWALI